MPIALIVAGQILDVLEFLQLLGVVPIQVLKLAVHLNQVAQSLQQFGLTTLLVGHCFFIALFHLFELLLQIRDAFIMITN